MRLLLNPSSTPLPRLDTILLPLPAKITASPHSFSSFSKAGSGCGSWWDPQTEKNKNQVMVFTP